MMGDQKESAPFRKDLEAFPYVSVSVDGVVAVDPDVAKEPQPRVVLAMSDADADRIAHVIDSAVKAAEAFGWNGEEVAAPERELADALHEASALSYRCRATWQTDGPVRRPAGAGGKPTEG